jgi:NTP pyrophosphatase (non-canonical NTP hydrolase)
METQMIDEDRLLWLMTLPIADNKWTKEWFGMSDYIKVGDIVRLVGTNMKMTVENVGWASHPTLGYEVFVHCVWFDRENICNRRIFKKEELTKVSVSTIEYNSLRKANEARQKEWKGRESVTVESVTMSFRGNELAGEVGEACNIIKKLERAKMGSVGSTATIEELAEELADVIIATDLIAMQADINLSSAVRNKFNKTSEKYGLKTRMKV